MLLHVPMSNQQWDWRCNPSRHTYKTCIYITYIYIYVVRCTDHINIHPTPKWTKTAPMAMYCSPLAEHLSFQETVMHDEPCFPGSSWKPAWRWEVKNGFLSLLCLYARFLLYLVNYLYLNPWVLTHFYLSGSLPPSHLGRVSEQLYGSELFARTEPQQCLCPSCPHAPLFPHSCSSQNHLYTSLFLFLVPHPNIP